MMKVIGRFALLSLVVTLAGCGPSVSVTKVQHQPAREGGCSLKFVDRKMTDFNKGDEWSLVGYVNLQKPGDADPFSDKYRKIVRKHACKMGGEAVALGMTSTQKAGMAGGSGTMYSVLVPASEDEGSKRKMF